MSIPQSSREDSLAKAIRKAAWRLLPLLALLYFVSFLDRVNVGFAALTMNKEIGLGAKEFGFGAGVFFLGYIAFAIPANLMLKRFGARAWLATIAIVWGVVALSMALVRTPDEFYVVRFLLGATESGFFPGVILYLSEWFPGRVIARVVANFFVAVPLSNVIGAPISSWLLEHGGFGLRGWQCMFILEGIPSILLGVGASIWLSDSPKVARWLDLGERTALELALVGEKSSGRATSLKAGLFNLQVWVLGVVYFLIVFGLYGFGFWAPQILRAIGRLSVEETGWATAIPYAAAALCMYAWSRHSDIKGERLWHVVAPSLASALGFLCAAHARSIEIAIFAFMVSTVGIYSACVVFWAMPRYLLKGAAAAGGIALINSIGNLAGYFGPVIMGWLKSGRVEYAAGLYAMAASMTGAGVVAYMMGSLARRVSPSSSGDA
jgi:MFS transporter, ACS family, tartrate transporter